MLRRLLTAFMIAPLVQLESSNSPKPMVLIRKSVETDLAAMLAIVNETAQVYRGVIPADR